MQVVSAHLSNDQAAALLRMRELYLQNLGALTRRRREGLAVLRVSNCNFAVFPSLQKAYTENTRTRG